MKIRTVPLQRPRRGKTAPPQSKLKGFYAELHYGMMASKKLEANHSEPFAIFLLELSKHCKTQEDLIEALKEEADKEEKLIQMVSRAVYAKKALAHLRGRQRN